MSLITRLAASWAEEHRREDEIARIPQSELDGMGLTRADLAAMVRMPDEQLNRMARMADLFEVAPGTLDRAPDLRREVVRTCATCSENSLCRKEMSHGTTVERAEMFCPNAATWQSLALG